MLKQNKFLMHMNFFFSGPDLLQSADLAILLTDSEADFNVGGEIDGVDPLRNPGKYTVAWVSKSYENVFTHELGQILGARNVIYYLISLSNYLKYKITVL